MMTKDKIINSILNQTAVLVINVPMYIAAVVVANKYPAYKWEIIVGFVYYILLCGMQDVKSEKG